MTAAAARYFRSQRTIADSSTRARACSPVAPGGEWYVKFARQLRARLDETVVGLGSVDLGASGTA